MRAVGGGVRRERSIGRDVSVTESGTWEDERRPPRLPETLNCRALEESLTPSSDEHRQLFRDAMIRCFLCGFSQ
ncbi:Hypothetical predicted protein [Scomber scombrus]|uniref:Uncharacterized protein n=1 Tax=Scomber scombrus TaxID=13677 RepID=A0AAV1Q9H1_SCOSC